METKQQNNRPQCVKVQFELCGEALKKVQDKQEEHYNTTGYSLSKPLAIIKLILGK